MLLSALKEQLARNTVQVSSRLLAASTILEMEERDRLGRFAWDLNRLCEYQFLQPCRTGYTGDELADEVSATAERTFDPKVRELTANLTAKVLGQAYKAALGKFEDVFLGDLQQGKQRLRESFEYGLTSAQLKSLNETGRMTINLEKEGYLIGGRDNLRLRSVDVARCSLKFFTPNGSARLVVAHDRISVLRRDGLTHEFTMAAPREWSSDFDLSVDRCSAKPAFFPPSLAAFLRRLANEKPVDDDRDMFVAPAYAGDLTLVLDANPKSAQRPEFASLSLRVTYEGVPQDKFGALYVVVPPPGESCAIHIQPTDVGGRSQIAEFGVSSYHVGERVELTACPSAGRSRFKGWAIGSAAPDANLTQTITIGREPILARALYE
jgi:hypothetical protein